jgi:beta-RFAP synthase
MIKVETGSRLHFGLLSFPLPPYWANQIGQQVIPTRGFGGVGLMVQKPGVALQIRPADHFSARGPLAERALSFIRCFFDWLRAEDNANSPPIRGLNPTPLEIILEHCAPDHAGLGTGTQLGLAVARGLQETWNFSMEAEDLCRQVGRGERSALGFHGFFQGGFLIEAGKSLSSTSATAGEGLGRPSKVSPLVAQTPFPKEWRILLVIPAGMRGVHGMREAEVFLQLLTHGFSLKHTETLCRLALLGLLPTLVENDYKGFSEALYDFNLLAGQAFAKFQGGPYAGKEISELIHFIRTQGIPGAGQSSWGPTVFAVVDEESRAKDLADRICRTFNLQDNEVLITSACNHGAVVSEVDN